MRVRIMLAIGDAVQSVLTRAGITSERVEKLLKVKDCGCAGRRDKLNKIGYAAQQRVARWAMHRKKWWLQWRHHPAAWRLSMARRHIVMAVRVLIYGQ